MRALGVTLIEHGQDFQENREFALRLATGRGVSTYWWEFMLAVPQLDVVYVPIDQGSGAWSAIAAMQARESLKGRVVGITLCGGNVDADVFARVLGSQGY